MVRAIADCDAPTRIGEDTCDARRMLAPSIGAEPVPVPPDVWEEISEQM